MAIFGRRRSSMGRVRQQAAPVAPNSAAQAAALRQFNQTKQPARQATPAEVAALNKRSPNVASYNEGMAKAFQQFNTQPKAPVMSSQEIQQAQRTGSAPAVSQQQMVKDIVAQNAAKGQNMMMQASMDAQQRFNEKQAQKAKATPAPVPQVPSPPPFRKGGAVKKKTGYAKGGAVMCGASMPPAQKRKK